MKIKHYQGYGFVEAKKISTKKLAEKDKPIDYKGFPLKRVQILVKGNHEYGLFRNDLYDIHRWLCTKLVKDCESYMDIVDYNIQGDYIRENGIDVETAIYTITYIVRD